MKYILICAVLCAASTFAQQPKAFEPYSTTIPGSEVSFKMLPIQAGSFNMGSAETEKNRATDEGPQKMIELSAFWMGEKEVTHDEFLLFFNDESLVRNSEVDAVTRPTTQYIDLSWGMGKQGGFPFNSMSQRTALMYCRWLYGKTGTFYRLPTEAEWEYACRAGTTTAYPFGDDSTAIGEYAWYAGNSENKYHKTGTKKPNAWGLYDMLGNVAEWTMDQYDEQAYTKLAEGAADPMMASTSRHPKAVRGGSFEDEADALRPAARRSWQAEWNKRDPQIPKSRWWLTDAYFVGFRVVRPVKQPTPDEAAAFYKTQLGQ